MGRDVRIARPDETDEERASCDRRALRESAAPNADAAMKATQGVLVTGDASLCQHIRHVDEQATKDPNQTSFIVAVLDETHLLVKEEAVGLIQREVKVLQDKNHFSKPAEVTFQSAG